MPWLYRHAISRARRGQVDAYSHGHWFPWWHPLPLPPTPSHPHDWRLDGLLDCLTVPLTQHLVDASCYIHKSIWIMEQNVYPHGGPCITDVCPHVMLAHSNKRIYPLVLRMEYYGKTKSIPRLLMSWRHEEPGHQQSGYWLNRRRKSLSFMRKEFHRF